VSLSKTLELKRAKISKTLL